MRNVMRASQLGVSFVAGVQDSVLWTAIRVLGLGFKACAPDVPLDVALAVLVAAPGVDGPPAVQRQAVPAARRRLHHARAPQRRDSPRLALVAPKRGKGAAGGEAHR